MNEDAKLAAVFPTLAESTLPIEELDIEVASRNSYGSSAAAADPYGTGGPLSQLESALLQ